MSVDKGPTDKDAEALNAVSEQYYNAIVFHAEIGKEIELPELWMLGLDPLGLVDRALLAERFDPKPE